MTVLDRAVQRLKVLAILSDRQGCGALASEMREEAAHIEMMKSMLENMRVSTEEVRRVRLIELLDEVLR